MSMENITPEQLQAEISEINLASDHNPTGAWYKAELDTGNERLYLDKVVAVDIHRDYIGNNGDVTIAKIMMPKGDFIKNVLPYMDDLKIMLINDVVGRRSSQEFLYKLDLPKEVELSEANKSASLESLNAEGNVEMIGQCIDETLLMIRKSAHVGLSYRKKTMHEVLSASLFAKTFIADLFSSSSRKLVNHITMPDNLAQYEAVVVPTGKPTLSVPKWLQTESNGVYNGGLSTYVQVEESTVDVYVFPPFGKDKLSFGGIVSNFFGKEENKLVIYKTPKKAFNTSDSTHMMVGNELRIVVSDYKIGTLPANIKLTNVGTGYYAQQADSVMVRTQKITKKDVKLSKGDMVNKGTNKKMKDGASDKYNHGPATSNFYKHRSKILENMGQTFTMTWEHSNARFLKPGMVTEVIEIEDDEPVVKQAILHGVHIKTSSGDNSYEECSLSVFVRGDQGDLF